MRRLLALATLAVCTAARSGGESAAASLSEVKRVLRAADLEPQDVKLMVTTAKQSDEFIGHVWMSGVPWLIADRLYAET
jgi:hypothetical protein